MRKGKGLTIFAHMVQNKNTISICLTEDTPPNIQFKISALQCTNDYLKQYIPIEMINVYSESKEHVSRFLLLCTGSF